MQKSQSKHNFICVQISYVFRVYVAIIRMKTQPYKIGIMIQCNKIVGAKSRLTLTVRRLTSYIYGAPILDVSRSHTATQHIR